MQQQEPLGPPEQGGNPDPNAIEFTQANGADAFTTPTAQSQNDVALNAQDAQSPQNTQSAQDTHAPTEQTAEVYEFELIEQEKQRQNRIARIIAIVLAIVGLLFGIANGYYDRAYSSGTTQKIAIANKQVCGFCFNAQNIDTVATALQGGGEFKLPNVKVKVTKPKCAESGKATQITWLLAYDAQVQINNIKIFVPEQVRVDSISINGRKVEFVTKTDENSRYVSIVYPKKVENLRITIYITPQSAGDYAIFPVIIYPNDVVQPTRAVELNVKDLCNATPEPTAQPASGDNTGSTEDSQTQEPLTTGKGDTGSTYEQSGITPTPPVTGIVEDTLMFFVGVIVGAIILHVLRGTYWADAFISFVGYVYKTANRILIKTFDSRTQTEFHILEKLQDQEAKKTKDSAKDSVASSSTSSPANGGK